MTAPRWYRVIAAMLIGASSTCGATTILIVNGDGAGEGFNDATAAVPEGGNTGVTLGEQRLILFRAAATQWAALVRSNRIIKINARFDPLTCMIGSAVLGSAGPTSSVSFPAPPVGFQANTFYPIALAEAGNDTNINAAANEINATFNSSVDTGCVGPGTRFWYGIDPSTPVPPGRFSLYPTVLHELGHGLGFITFVCTTPGGCGATVFGGLPGTPPRPDIWSWFVANAPAPAVKWKDMTDAQRAAGVTSDPNLVWTGAIVTADRPTFTTTGTQGGFMRLHAPLVHEPGSSVAHWTTVATPDLLMEPVLQPTVFNNTDLTYSLFRDIGWLARPRDTLFADNYDAR